MIKNISSIKFCLEILEKQNSKSESKLCNDMKEKTEKVSEFHVYAYIYAPKSEA
jgi:hypothetical protein